MVGTRNGHPWRGKGLFERIWGRRDRKYGVVGVWGGKEWAGAEVWNKFMIYFSFFRLRRKSPMNKLMDSAVPIMHGGKIPKTCIHVLFWILIWIQTFLHFCRKWTNASTNGCVESHILHSCFRIIVYVSLVHARILVVWHIKWVWFLLWFVHVHILFWYFYWRFVLLEMFELRFFGWNIVFRVGEIGMWQYFLDSGTFVGCHSENRLDQVNLIRSWYK